MKTFLVHTFTHTDTKETWIIYTEGSESAYMLLLAALKAHHKDITPGWRITARRTVTGKPVSL